MESQEPRKPGRPKGSKTGTTTKREVERFMIYLTPGLASLLRAAAEREGKPITKFVEAIIARNV